MRRHTPAPRARRGSRGFTYLVLLFSVALISTGLAAGGTVWSQVQRREREARLLWTGDQFRRALTSYAAAGDGQFPRRLEDLLDDPRSAAKRRHLRRLYEDPITRRADWALVRDERGGIVGVHSRSEQAALRSSRLPAGLAVGDPPWRYADWVFSVRPLAARPAAAASAAAAAAPPHPRD